MNWEEIDRIAGRLPPGPFNEVKFKNIVWDPKGSRVFITFADVVGSDVRRLSLSFTLSTLGDVDDRTN